MTPQENSEKQDGKRRSLILLLLLLLALLGGGGLLFSLSQAARETPALLAVSGGDAVPEAEVNVRVRARASESGEFLNDFNIVWTVFRLDADQQRVEVGSWPLPAGRFALPPGPYIVQGRRGAALGELLIEVPANGTLEEVLVIGSGQVRISAVLAAGGEAISSPTMRWEAARLSPDGQRTVVLSHPFAGGILTLDEGPHLLTTHWGALRADAEVTVVAGQTLTHEMILNAGIINLSALEADASPASNASTALRVYRIEADASRTPLIDHPFAAGVLPVPAGAHHVEARGSGGRIVGQDIEVRAGTVVDLTLNLGR